MAAKPKPISTVPRTAVGTGKVPAGTRRGANGEPTGVPRTPAIGSAPNSGRSSGGGQRSTRRV